jgi:hypothetical protein
VLIAPAALGCERVAAGEMIWIRLTSSVSTYNAKPGEPVHAVLTEDVTCGGDTLLPIGAAVRGTVQSVRKVGLGIKHETAALQITFTEISVAPDEILTVNAMVAGIDNAREEVVNGVVHGIRSTSTPQGRITSRLKYLPSLNPYPDLGLILFKATFPIFPEPEIYLPAGTDIELKLTEPLVNPLKARASMVSSQPTKTNEAEPSTLVSSWPRRSTTLAMASADIVNLAFIGSRQQVETAFRNAGWRQSDSFSRHTFLLNFYAFLNNSGYAQAPMRPFLLEGRPSDMNWEKSLNSYARRDHLRIWEWTQDEDSQTLWLSSSTHDNGASLSLKYREFVHHIDPEIDHERSKVIRDLNAAGCVESVSLVPRNNVANLTQNAIGDPVKTDRALAIVRLKDCHPVTPELASVPTTMPYKPGNTVFRYLRRQVLTFRSDIWRANIIYGSYDLVRMTVHQWRHRSALALAGNSVKTPDRN